MKRFYYAGLLLSVLPLSAYAWDAPTMGWSSWNSFGHRINEEIIRSQADAMVKTGLLDAGYKYVNIDDGAWCGRDEEGHLRIHPQRFPNGLKDLVDYMHSLGLKAGTYSDAGHNTCASYYGGDTDGIGTGLYEHDIEDARFFFNELGFDFIKVDFCGGDAPQNSERLELDERERYTAISEAIKATGRDDVRYNVCRWAYPGTWVEDIATSWRMSQDINASWESVKGIIHRNLYLSAYATKGRFNDMDMLEVGRGMTPEEDKTHFGMWCMMSSPLLIGCDLRSIDKRTLALLTNEELIALNQDPLALQATVAKKEKGGYVLVKDVDKLRSTSRAVAFYNPTDAPLEMSIDFYDIDLGENVAMRDLFEKEDLGSYNGSFSVTVPAHGTRIYRATADRRTERRVYEAETAWIDAYQEIDNNQVVKSGVYEERDNCSGGAKASWLGARADNSLSWREVWSDEGGEYEMTLYFITGENRKMTLDINGETIDVLTVNSGGWDTVGSKTLKVNLQKGENTITLSNASEWMPDIDCMTLVKEGDLDLLRHRHQTALNSVLKVKIDVLPDGMRENFHSQIQQLSEPEDSRDGYESSTAALNKLEIEMTEALRIYADYQATYMKAEDNIAASAPSEALDAFVSFLESVTGKANETLKVSNFNVYREEIEKELRKYLLDERALVKEGESWDLTALINNPSFHTDSYGWDEQPVWGSHVAEFWNRSFSTFQTVSGLRNGNYVVSVQALYRLAGNDGGDKYKKGTEVIPARFIANDEEIPVASLYTHPLSETPELDAMLSGTHVLRGYVNSMYGAEQAFNHSLYINELPVEVKDGTLRIGLKCDTAEGDCWCCFDNFALRYYGASDTAVDEVNAEKNDKYDVYTVTGICVGKNMDKSAISQLPEGLYVINGQKTIITHK